MNILVINCGSSSVKSAVLDSDSGELLARMRIERIGEPEPTLKLDDGEPTAVDGKDHEEALGVGIPKLLERLGDRELDGVGHRVVHGGEKFSEPARIDDEVEAAIEALIPLAPLHNPANLAGIRAARKALPDRMHVAVFDTAFHATLPSRAKAYAIDKELADKHGVRRYGFHGTSHRYVAHRAARFLDHDIDDLRLITVHLGNGASICAVEFGRSVEAWA
jgi:acetate kinase